MHVSNDFRQRDSATFYSKSLHHGAVRCCDCGFLLGMSTDTFGILLGNVIFAVYIGVFSDTESEICSDGRRIRQGNHSGTVSD